MIDVVIAGAGPAGCIAAIVLARAGARVVMVDRARFPRPKLCGDSVNPGAIALLHRLGLARATEPAGVPCDGMLVTGEHGVRIRAVYPDGVRGRFISRTDFDSWLLREALAAGVEFEESTRVVAAQIEDATGGRRVAGVRVRGRREGTHAIRAALTIGAEGRRSPLAFALGLARHPARPRRWAIGGYFEGVSGACSLGEMHIRQGHYIGLAPLPGGLTNVCLVTADVARWRSIRGQGSLICDQVRRDPILRPRFEQARSVNRPIALGPLAVDCAAPGIPGLLLAGDAAGFIDPMTGDGLYFAMRGGELAAHAALLALSASSRSPHDWLAAQRAVEFRWKQRFNRTLRTIVAHPGAVALASHAGGRYPGVIERLVRIAGDVGRRPR